MYCALPMPQFSWTARNMRYAICAFPLVGVASGTALLLCGAVLGGRTPLLFAALATLLPVLISGGIHLDGFCDTIDALSSHGEREKKLAILKDPHIGAFGVMGCCCYFLITFALWATFSGGGRVLGVLALGQVFARLLSALSVLTFPLANPQGSLAVFAQYAKNSHSKEIVWLGLCIVAASMIFLEGKYGISVILLAVAVFVYYRKMAGKRFGGITGDLAGFFVELCQCLMLLCCVLLGL